ncbi:16S rRNA (cytidine(1402)-2'-O)-methyltransferase [Hydrogenophaga sp. NFH-34]|uniref:16S rRNA (cytidine(1402)-2'-O)-methyltransferase n=1 Tax=Hydrogenophaga sp. NFH-34 TaxID=2744446 RepID=UPI001F26DDC7|nr:16S rRNA (cytidine(1402)-2'-O)-methyltransferase [Hydrogenophaga sp. NFH-34]
MPPTSPSLLAAARELAGSQHYPQGALYMVATPIGNLADIGLRALHVLDLADTVACEDTRHTAALLQAYGLHKPLLALHEHNEAQAAQTVVQRLQAGERVAYVSDAGTPGVSDPGARLCAVVAATGLRCVPLPGASSVTALLSVAGLGGGDSRFVFAGFLPPKSTERRQAVQALAADPRTTVLLEAPHRIVALAADLAVLGERTVTVGRELTKQFEQVAQMPASALPAWFDADPNRQRGEFALILHPAPPRADEDALDAATLKTLDRLLAELPVKTAVKVCADITGAPRNRLYDLALQRRAAPTAD